MSPDSSSTRMSASKVVMGSDHAGYELKERIKTVLDGLGVGWEDVGTNSTDSCDYPDYARKVAEAVSNGQFERGIICCGSGIGVSIVANKVRNIRAALCHDVQSAMLSRQHNDANILCLGARLADQDLTPQVVRTWLETAFEGGRHGRRVEKIEVRRKTD